MKRIFSLLLIALLSICAYSQSDTLLFHLQKEGVYQSSDGKDYVIIPYEGKSAHELYTSLLTNSRLICNSPTDAVNKEEDKSIVILFHCDKLGIYKKKAVSGSVKIMLDIKDGRIKLSAPFIGNDVSLFTRSSSLKLVFEDQGYAPRGYGWYTSKYYDKKGRLYKEWADEYRSIEKYMNDLLWKLITIDKITNEDW